jgi:hypothetical protein
LLRSVSKKIFRTFTLATFFSTAAQHFLKIADNRRNRAYCLFAKPTGMRRKFVAATHSFA